MDSTTSAPNAQSRSSRVIKPPARFQDGLPFQTALPFGFRWGEQCSARRHGSPY
ncbi:Hypothetical protein FKW44_003777 [Caligus rogercresseyi]|uniref:Uncharacterized protein n=1 Tax=Caligus rogercresseyi TaxID=217165 RepID=A0A7T8KM36_CALRO|nr:Hypothetical protein FKW44_003777 [Caligus rogercresseyi]